MSSLPRIIEAELAHSSGDLLFSELLRLDESIADEEVETGDLAVIAIDVMFNIEGRNVLREVLDLMPIDRLLHTRSANRSARENVMRTDKAYKQGRLATAVTSASSVSSPLAQPKSRMVQQQQATIRQREAEIDNLLRLVVVIVGFILRCPLTVDHEPALQVLFGDTFSDRLCDKVRKVRDGILDPFRLRKVALPHQLGDAIGLVAERDVDKGVERRAGFREQVAEDLLRKQGVFVFELGGRSLRYRGGRTGVVGLLGSVDDGIVLSSRSDEGADSFVGEGSDLGESRTFGDADDTRQEGR